LLLAGCRTPPQIIADDPVQRSQPLLGTFVTITAYGEDRPTVQQAISEAFDSIRQIDALLSLHREDSELVRLNATAGRGPSPASPELYAAISSALAISRKTVGAFDPTIGPIAQLWGFIRKEYRLPTQAELSPLLPLVNFRNVLLHPNNRIELQQAGMLLDFGGIGKGMAVDAAIATLQQRGLSAAMVKAGGDLRVFGTPPGQNAWQVQLEDPAKKGRRNTIALRSGALSTSGNYENYFEVDGRRYSHIIDPRSGLPIQGIASCTVLAPTCTESDALATAFFVLGIEDSLARFGTNYGIRFLDDRLKVTVSKEFKALTSRAAKD
jgi:FAD:protein FMN transferase